MTDILTDTHLIGPGASRLGKSITRMAKITDLTTFEELMAWVANEAFPNLTRPLANQVYYSPTLRQYCIWSEPTWGTGSLRVFQLFHGAVHYVPEFWEPWSGSSLSELTQVDPFQAGFKRKP